MFSSSYFFMNRIEHFTLPLAFSDKDDASFDTELPPVCFVRRSASVLVVFEKAFLAKL